MNTTRNIPVQKRQSISPHLLLLLLVGVGFSQRLMGASIALEGQSKGDTNWIGGNLQNWAELDYIPCRVHFTSAAGSNQVITVNFEHQNGTKPGVQNLFNFTKSSNVVFSSAPTLSAPSSGAWSYGFKVDVLDDQPGDIWFFARLAAGAHLNVGSSLDLSGSPSSMGNLQIHKPGAGPGSPDLLVSASGAANARRADTLTYTLGYTNKSSAANTATGVQLTAILPTAMAVVTNSIPNGGTLIGTTLYWDLPNLAVGTGGQFSFQAQVETNASAGQALTNFVQILSAEDDLNYSDNTSLVVTIVTNAANAAPTVSAGPDRTSIFPAGVTLAGEASDDQLPNGNLSITWSKVSGPGTVTFGNANLTNTSAQFSQGGVYILRMTADDGSLSTSDDMMVVENVAPFVDAGPDQTNAVLFASLTGTVSDDGLPEGGTLSATWTKVSGPGEAVFENATNQSTTVNFSEAGVYSLRLTVGDSISESDDDVTIAVNAPPVVNAGPDLRVTVGEEITLAGSVTDDGLPAGIPLQISWSLVSGVGVFQLANPNSATTTARVLEIGTYGLRLTGSDSLATNSDEVVITVLPVNRAPTIVAGPKQLVLQPATANLTATVSDDGLPENAAVTVAWSRLNGPGAVSFSNPTGTNTTATFSETGDYVLRATASDSALSSYSDMKIAVRTPAMNLAPVVTAGADKLIGLTNLVSLGGYVSDDGLPQGQPITVQWSVVSGPGSVTFANDAVTNAQATFSAAGGYVLRLTANDSALSASDEVSVTVYPHNQPPVVDAGRDQTIPLPDPALLYPNAFAITNVNVFPSLSLLSVDHWSETFGVPGVTGAAVGPGTTWVYRNGLAVDAGTLVAAGAFTNVGGTWAKSLARFDGASWYNFYDTNAAPDLCGQSGCSQGYVWWLVFDCGNNPYCSEVFNSTAIRGNEVFASGGFKDLGNLDGLMDSTARWDGERWRDWCFKTAGGQLYDVKATPNKVYVFGNFSFQPTNATSQTITNLSWSYNIATWDGTNWGTLGEGVTDIRNLPSSTPGLNINLNAYVTSMAVATNGDVYVAGSFLMSTPTGIATNVAKWNGATWSPLGSGLQSGRYDAVQMSGMVLADNGDLYVGSTFTNAGGYAARNFARWDGVRWWPVGAGAANGVAGSVEAVARHGRDIYVGGAFTEAGGVTAWRIAKWNGQFWSALGSGTSVSNGIYGGTVYSLAADDTGIYVGGTFTTAGGVHATNLTKWEFAIPPPMVAQLQGRVTDDGLPPDVPIDVVWTKTSGPGAVTFANSNAPVTTASFSAGGDYVLRLSANDSEFTTLDEVDIHVIANQPPVVNAGHDVVNGVSEAVLLEGTVTDDGLPQNANLVWSWSVIGGPGTVTFGNATSTNTTVRFSQTGTYVLRLSANDSQFSAYDDVTIVVTSDNHAPSTGFGITFRTVPFGVVTNISVSTLSDDGLPINVTNLLWSQVSGPGIVSFGSPTNGFTTLAFSLPGVYVIRLNANDSELSAFSDVTFTVTMGNNTAPIVNGGPDLVLTNLTALLRGTVTDDGLPSTNSLSVYWSKNSGPGTVTFTSSNSPVTGVTFSKPGTYILTLNATDSISLVSDTVIITFPNQTPVANAGPDRTIVQPTMSLLLTGSATDDGQPYPTPSASWSKVSGPGTVTFSSQYVFTNTATFSSTGTYVLRLSASDSGVAGTDDMVVTVVPAGNQPPVVNAGNDVTQTWPNTNFTLIGSISDDGLPTGSTPAVLWSKFSGPGAVTFSSASATSTTASFDQPGTYTLRLTGNDSALTNADDVVVVIFPATNQPPVASAGSDQTIVVTNMLTLSGSVTDDGLPLGSALLTAWQKLSGPGPVYFASGTNATTNLNTTARFAVPGAYVLRLTGTDSAAASSATVNITVLPVDSNLPPVVSAGPDMVAAEYAPLALPGWVTDDGLPAGGVICVAWSKISGPGNVYFSNAARSNSTASFYLPGTYVLRLTATDGRATAYDDVTINAAPPFNEAPLAYAGSDLVVTRPHPAMLEAAVFDDGLPAGYPLTYQWTNVSGPGTVTFVPGSGTVTNLFVDGLAYFSTAGTYVLRLNATDSQLSDNDEITVTVLPGTNLPPVVNAGADQSIALPQPAILTTDVSDDGLENGLLEISWSKVSGPGPVYFSTVDGVYRATFTTQGNYVLRLSAGDGTYTNSDTMAVTVYDAPAPVAQIFSPADGGTITAPTNIIGTASSAILRSYVLEYRLAGATSISSTGGAGQGEPAAWSVLASNTVSVTSNSLALFDPTLLLNGLYELRLTVTDILGRSITTDPVSVIVDRNLKIGHFTISFNDLAVPVPGLPLQITRTYDSRAAAAGIQGDFGIGWTLDVRNVRLQKNRSLTRNWEEITTGSPWDLSLAYHLNGDKPRIVTITFPDGRVEKFQLVPFPMDQPLIPIGTPQWNFVRLGNTRGSLVPAGYDETDGQFLYFAGGIPGVADLYDLNYFFEWFNGNATLDDLQRYPTLFRYTTPEGYNYLIDEVAGLQSVTDPNGNTLLVSTNSLTWTNTATTNGASLAIAFQRDQLSRITNIVDAAGHALHYTYGTNGDLISFTDRVGQTNGFAYTNAAFPHYLTGIVDPFGVTPLNNEYDVSGRLVRNVDIYGGVIQYVHDLTNLTTSVTDRNGSQITQEFDEEGNLIRAVDALGGVTTCMYDEEGRRLSRTNPLNETEFYTYNATNGALIAVVNALGQTNTFTYSTNGQVTQATERDGTPLIADYDSNNNVTRVVDTLGNATVYAYNAAGRAVYRRDALGNEAHSEYDAFGNLTRSTNSLGNVTEFGYDANNRISLQVLTRTTNGVTQRLTNSWVYDSAGRVTAVLSPDGSAQQTIYDPVGRIAATIEELGRGTTNHYDLLGRLVQVVYPDGGREGYAYDAGDRKIATTNRLGQVTRLLYDALNRPVITINPDGTGMTNYFNAGSRLIATTDARGNSTWFGYDMLGRVIATTNALGEVTRFAYDARGNQITATDALGRTTTNVFDLANRLVAVLYTDGTATSNRYDALGRKVAELDQLGRVTQYGYDSLGRLVAVTNALNQVTRYEFNELGEQTAQIDASGRVTRYEYDTRGRRVSRILPLGHSDLATYDDFGNLTSYRDFNGNVTTYQYDSLNRLTQKTPDARLGDPPVSFTYNPLGQRTNMVDASGVTSYRYDERNRLIEKATPKGTLTYDYDANGNLASIRSSNTNGVSVTYEHDALNRLSAVNDANLGRTAYTYDAAGNLRGFTYPNLVHHEYNYDVLNRLTNVAGSHLLDSLISYTYTLAPNGLRTLVTESHGRVVNYAYDVLNRLTTETVSGVLNAGSATYTYDAVGNRLARNSNLPGILASSYAYDDNDRLLSDVYDNNGNTRAASMRDPVSQLTMPVSDVYNFENQLTDRNSGQIRVVYDGDGNRVYKTVTTATNTVTTYYLVDDLNPTGYPQVMEEHQAINNQPSTINCVYTWGHSLISRDRLDGNTWTESYYGYDGQSSVRYLTDRNGNITDTFDFDAFGNLTHHTGSTPNDYLYQGEQYDSDLKLYYLRARYADPDRGRFWTQDSFESFGTDPQSLHKYTFCHNDPVNLRDPSGHMTLMEIMNVVVEAPIVRGALLALQKAFTACAIKSAAMGALVGGVTGGVISEGITAMVDAITGKQSTTEELLSAFASGFADGAIAGGLIAWNPFTAGAYFGYSAYVASMDFWKHWHDPNTPLWVKYMDAVNIVASLAPLAPSVSRRLNALLQQFCFPGGTEIAAADGPKPIEGIREGDLVWAHSDRTGESMLKRVKRTFVNMAAALVVLTTGASTLEATPEHPLWVVDQGWKAASQIQVGDELWTRSGERMAVTDIGHKQGRFIVYNFETEDFHSYYVGRSQVLGHNKCTQISFFDRHHALPKFLGGDPDQMLTYLTRETHQELTQMIADKLASVGLEVRKAGGKFVSSGEWAEILKDDTVRQKAFNALADATREFDLKYGTKVMHDLWKNIFNP